MSHFRKRFVIHSPAEKAEHHYYLKKTVQSTLEIQPATLYGEKCVRLYLLRYLSISVFTTQNFRIKGKNENLF
jgi:hypothetical protein